MIEKITTYGGPGDPFVRITESIRLEGECAHIDIEVIPRGHASHVGITCNIVEMPWYRRLLPDWLRKLITVWRTRLSLNRDS